MIVAAVLAGVAVLLLARPVVTAASPRRVAVTPWAVAMLVPGVVLLPPAWAVQAGVVAVLGIAVRALLHRRGARRARRTAEEAVLEACELIAADLRAGLPPGEALARAAAEWAPLASVAMAGRLDADVPTAFRAAAAAPGQGDLTLVAASWQVSQRSGSALAVSLSRVAGRLRTARAVRAIVDSELASARATARLMAGLPVLAMAMGAGVGGDPLHFLFGTTAGLVCLTAGVLANLTGLWWIDRIADSIEETA